MKSRLERKWGIRRYVHPQGSLQHYLQKLRQGSDLNVHQQGNGWRRCGVYTCTHTMEYYSAMKGWNEAICSNMDGPRDYHTEWIMSDRDKNHMIPLTSGLLRWLSGKESTCQCRRHRFDPWVGEFPWRRKWQLTSVFLPGKSWKQRSLVGYSPWGRKESDAPEHTRTTYRWNLKRKYKRTYLKTNLWLPKGTCGGGISWEFGINIYTLLYIKKRLKDLLYSTGNFTWESGTNYMGKGSWKPVDICIYMTESLGYSTEINTIL